MIYNENGIIINNGYQLDILINEGFSDIANAGLKGIHTLIRKLIDLVQNTIEYASRIPYGKIIKNIDNMSEEEFNKRLLSYHKDGKDNELCSENLDKYIVNFNAALSQLKSDHNLSIEEINKILYDGKSKEAWFGVVQHSKTASTKTGTIRHKSLKKIVTNLQDFTKPLRKSYSELKILNTNINKNMKIDPAVMKEMYSYCTMAISEYRSLSKKTIQVFKNPVPEKEHNANNSIDNKTEIKKDDNIEEKTSRADINNKIRDEVNKKTKSRFKSDFFEELNECDDWAGKRSIASVYCVYANGDKIDEHIDMNDAKPDINDIDENYLNKLEKNLKKNFSKERLVCYRDSISDLLYKNPKDTKLPLS